MSLINASTLRGFFVNLRNDFNKAYQEAPSIAKDLATIVNSNSKFNVYGWLGQFPSMRQWIGDKQLKDFSAHNYSLTNLDYEQTMWVDRNDLEDDQFSMFSPMAAMQGQTAALHPDQLIFSSMNNGTSTTCYDGKNFFATDHPAKDITGADTTIANYTAGGGVAWYLLCLNRPIKPFIWQVRSPYTFKQMIQPDDEMVFMSRQFRYGVESRVANGYGLWQFAYRSNATLDATAYAAARAAMMAITGDEGRPLGIVPTHLVVPPSLNAAARAVVAAERNASGASNVWYKDTELIVSPFLTNS